MGQPADVAARRDPSAERLPARVRAAGACTTSHQACAVRGAPPSCHPSSRILRDPSGEPEWEQRASEQLARRLGIITASLAAAP